MGKGPERPTKVPDCADPQRDDGPKGALWSQAAPGRVYLCVPCPPPDQSGGHFTW